MNRQKQKTKAAYDYLKSQIRSNTMPLGVKLPSESELMETFDISRYGARKVVNMLVEEKLVRKHQGKGCFVCAAELPPDTATDSRQILLIASRAEHFYFLKSINGIERALQESDYSLTIKLSNYNAQLEGTLLQKALLEHYAGFLIYPSESAYMHTNLHLYRYIENKKIPCITLGNKLCSVGLPSVITDDYFGGGIAADYFMQMGHRTFACVMNREEYSGCMRYAGFLEKLYQMQIPDESHHIFWFGHREKDSLFTDRARELLDLASKVTAFFCFNDAAAVNLYQLLTESGVRVPEDVSIIGYDDSYLCEINPLPLTALHQDPETAGYTAAKNLLRLIQDSSYNCNRIFLPYLVERQSVCNLNGK